MLFKGNSIFENIHSYRCATLLLGHDCIYSDADATNSHCLPSSFTNERQAYSRSPSTTTNYLSVIPAATLRHVQSPT